ncbi:hypothetical protein Nepgr_015442 [Nepenthes gracilis]|uniref:Uncharacterized protein n=1 Tax=Nepenthes gracilis TaxID=150966 RepID=A0AAD3SNM5_NEPGR|nr:hypothetical protein Nepgr_015442 [Nepenthes gracilis]
MVAAAASLALGTKSRVGLNIALLNDKSILGIWASKKDGMMGGAIAFAVILVTITSTSDYKQSLLFQSLNEGKQNVLLEVFRGGRRREVLIFDIAVGLSKLVIREPTKCRSHKNVKYPTILNHHRGTTTTKTKEWGLLEDGLILLAIVGIKDPCRPAIRDAIRLCTSAGVKSYTWSQVIIFKLQKQ